jgi:hypothetical protein
MAGMAEKGGRSGERYVMRALSTRLVMFSRAVAAVILVA